MSFHAAACTVAVCVTTPSMSNRQAVIWLGRRGPGSAAAVLASKSGLVFRQFQVGFGEFLDVHVLEGDHPDVLDETRRAVHIPHPCVTHRDLEVHLTVVGTADVQLYFVGEIEPAFGLDHVAEKADHIAVLAIELELHLRLVLLQVLGAHDSILPSSSVAFMAGSGWNIRRRTLTNERRCSGHGPYSSSARTCSSVEYPLCRSKPYWGYRSCRSVIIRSRLTLAITEAAATEAVTLSPFHTASPGVPQPATGNPSVST